MKLDCVTSVACGGNSSEAFNLNSGVQVWLNQYLNEYTTLLPD